MRQRAHPRSPYYEINASGRVPYLVRDDGVGMEHSDLIAAYLDHIDGKPTFSYVDLLADRLRLTLWAERLMRHPSVRETMSDVLR